MSCSLVANAQQIFVCLVMNYQAFSTYGIAKPEDHEI